MKLSDGLSFLDWNKHTRNYDHDYERYDDYDYYLKGHFSGSDCANFISQALSAGGVKRSHGWNFKWDKYQGYHREIEIPDATGSWIRPELLLNYLKKSGYVNGDVLTVNSVAEMKNVVKKDGIQIGDLMFFKDSKEGIHHLVMITAVNSNGTIRFSGHSNDRINESLTYKYFKGNGDIAEQILVVRMK